MGPQKRELAPERGLISDCLLEKLDPLALMITKRQLGIFVIVLSAVALVGIVAVDALGAGQWGGLGPLQQLGIGLGCGSMVIGVILVRLGDRPA